MLVRKCDLCKKNIKNDPIMAGISFLNKKEFCDKCGAPIMKFLKKRKLIEIKENNVKR